MIRYVAFITLATATIFSSVISAATYTFHYSNNLILTVVAENTNAAYKKSAIICFKTLTNGAYPGEEAGLAIIDICANPLNFKL